MPTDHRAGARITTRSDGAALSDSNVATHGCGKSTEHNNPQQLHSMKRTKTVFKLLEEIGGGYYSWSPPFPEAFRQRCIRLVYPNSPDLHSQTSAGNVTAYSIALTSREWARRFTPPSTVSASVSDAPGSTQSG